MIDSTDTRPHRPHAIAGAWAAMSIIAAALLGGCGGSENGEAAASGESRQAASGGAPGSGEQTDVQRPVASPSERVTAQRGLGAGSYLAGADLPDGPAAGRELRRQVQEEVEKLRQERRRLDETVWAREMEAQRYERAIVELWDELNRSDDALGVLAAAPFERLALPEPTGRAEHDHDITITEYGRPGDGPYRSLSPGDWRRLLERYSAAGYRLEMTDWSHEMFEPSPPVSTIAAALYALNPSRRHWATIRAELRVTWSAPAEATGVPTARDVTVVEAQVMERTGEPMFGHVLRIDPTAEERQPTRIEPLLVYDLNGDGLPEIIAADANRIYWNGGQGRFRRDRFFREPLEIQKAALFADFTGDGAADLVCASHGGMLWLFPGDPETGRAEQQPIVINTPQTIVQNMTAVTAGDIDGDGDLDLWVGQYKPPYMRGQMPTPYYNANDGFPAYLFRNDGEGHFTDITEEAGLAAKRHRRTYSASLVDLDDDGDQDLLVVSDFSGIDVYRNDGDGRFTDVTERIVPQWHNFGMSHTFDDFNGDGRLDFIVLGMSTAAARRLDRMGLGRDDRPDYHRMRPVMTHGNRMYLGAADGGFRTPAFADRIARTGWSWGVASFDADNDGDRDMYVTNGHITGRSVADYCSVFWRHDIYTGDSAHDPVTYELFNESLADVNAREQSWDGYQKNVLFMNRGGEGFLNAAWPMGVAFQFDARALASADLDGDGRVDLLVVEDRGREGGQVLHVLRNNAPPENNWIGVRLREHGGGFTPVGARVTLHTMSGTQRAWIATGDVFWAQNPNVAHFGLGGERSVEAIEVRWPNGEVSRVEKPAINRYHDVKPRIETKPPSDGG